jgi:hypothetical protein
MWNNVTYLVDRIVSGTTEGYHYHRVDTYDTSRYYLGKIYEVEDGEDIKKYAFLYPRYERGYATFPFFPAISASTSSFTYYNGNTIDNWNINSNNLKFKTWTWSYNNDNGIPGGTSGRINGSVTKITNIDDWVSVDTDYTASGKQLYGGIPLSTYDE